MINFFTGKILNFFDYFYKKKIIKKILEIKKKQILKVVFDIGGHRGESIQFFLENLKIQNIYSFEPSELNFKALLKKSKNLKKKFSSVNFFLENYAIGDTNKNTMLNYLNETSSSSIQKLNTESNYYKKKSFFSVI
jgi:FkbM family methyltransferase